LTGVSNIIHRVGAYIGVQTQKEMKNQFERAIRTKLGIHEGELDPADLLKITTLQINSASQEDINDLFLTPSLINLTIICEGDIDLSPLDALPLLDSLKITNANLLSKLISLRLKNCDIDDLAPLEGLERLLTLNLNENNIEDLTPISALEELKSLDIEGNEISNLDPLSSIDGITWIHAARNYVRDLGPLTTMKTLESLDVGRNRVTNIDALSKITSLSWLGLSFNNIRDISPINSLPNLRYLDIEGDFFNQQSTRTHLPNLAAKGIDIFR